MGLASEVVMIDINSDKALGEALDIRQGSPFCSPCKVYAGSYRDAAGSNIVILTSGVARKPGQTRLELAQTNVDITKTIIPNIVRYAPDAIYILVSNPVDVLTYTFNKISGLPQEHIIGSGTILDTARLRARLAEYYKINQQNIHAYVMGAFILNPYKWIEHQFPPVSFWNIYEWRINWGLYNYAVSLLGKKIYCISYPLNDTGDESKPLLLYLPSLFSLQP